MAAALSLFVAMEPATATVIGAPAVARDSAAPKSLSGLALLKAQMNALRDGLENIRRLRDFFAEDAAAPDAIVNRAERLIGSLPAHENAGEAAWRIAGVASLSLKAGKLSRIEIDSGYRLKNGAIGWDFGIDGAGIHPGFTPMSLERFDQANGAASGSSQNVAPTWSDGSASRQADKFAASLPNGIFRILIIAEQGGEYDLGANPFGNDIGINGASIGRSRFADRDKLEKRRLTGRNGGKLASTEDVAIRKSMRGMGIEGWTVVENGALQIDFGGIANPRRIKAIIAEPIDLSEMELAPEIAEALAASFDAVAPAAGPEEKTARRPATAPRPSFAGGSQAASAPAKPGAAAVAKASRKGASAAPKRRKDFVQSFQASRARAAQFASGAPNAAGTADSGPALLEQAVDSSEDSAPDFFDRQILVKRGGSKGEDSDGLAVDLADLLDRAADSGVFLCTEEPCAADFFELIAVAPDLSAAEDALGDWLTDPQNLPDGWEAASSLFENWTAGSEIAAVYTFDVDVDLWTNVELRANADDGLLVWIDGVFVFGASGPGANEDDLGFDYRVLLPDIAGGEHVLQIIAESRGPDSPELSFELRGMPVGSPTAGSTANAVPEPGALALFAIGLIGMIAVRRRYCGAVRG